MRQLTRRTLIDGSRLAVALLVIVACLAVIGWTIVRPYFGDFAGGLGTTECLEFRPIPEV